MYQFFHIKFQMQIRTYLQICQYLLAHTQFFCLRQEKETEDTEKTMLVPGMYTAVMLGGENRPITFPSQNQHIHEPPYNLEKVTTRPSSNKKLFPVHQLGGLKKKKAYWNFFFPIFKNFFFFTFSPCTF